MSIDPYPFDTPFPVDEFTNEPRLEVGSNPLVVATSKVSVVPVGDEGRAFKATFPGVHGRGRRLVGLPASLWVDGPTFGAGAPLMLFKGTVASETWTEDGLAELLIEEKKRTWHDITGRVLWGEEKVE